MSSNPTAIYLHFLVEFSQKLCQENNPEPIWQSLDDILKKTKIAENWGIFQVDGEKPIYSNSPKGYIWQELGKNSSSVCITGGISTVSIRIHHEFFLHVENRDSISTENQIFLQVLANFLCLWIKKEKFMSRILGKPNIENLPKETASDEEATAIIVPDKSVKALLRKQLTYSYPEIIGESQALFDVLKIVDRIAKSDQIPVLIQGESGTGKELVARAIHNNSPRAKMPFIAENTAAITETLLESELFGHTRGSFTGAIGDKKGLFELAHTGTLFLDEIGDMSLGMQKKILRAIQEGEIRAIGSKQVKKLNVRLIAATNKNLQEQIKQGTFREDLYYRLNVVNVVLPALRNRSEDIWLLFQYFVNTQAPLLKKTIPKISAEVREVLLHYTWPGNIREMQNEVKRALALLEGDTITPKNLSPTIHASMQS